MLGKNNADKLKKLFLDEGFNIKTTENGFVGFKKKNSENIWVNSGSNEDSNPVNFSKANDFQRGLKAYISQPKEKTVYLC